MLDVPVRAPPAYRGGPGIRCQDFITRSPDAWPGMFSAMINAIRPSNPVARFATWLLLGTVFGCGEAPEPYRAIQGRVTYQGKPVPHAVVVFESTAQELTIAADADEQGIYKAIRSVNVPGLPIGSYRVAVTPPLFYPGLGPVGKNPGPPTRDDIPASYRESATSGLAIDVRKEGSAASFDIEMK